MNARSSTGVFNSLQFLDSLTEYYASPAGVFKTTNGGLNWTTDYLVGMHFIDSTHGWISTGGKSYILRTGQ